MLVVGGVRGSRVCGPFDSLRVAEATRYDRRAQDSAHRDGGSNHEEETTEREECETELVRRRHRVEWRSRSEFRPREEEGETDPERFVTL
ncbi:hypothetical protein [Halomarina oriensis]|uniref:Uncharacterized protein n=1 Tax=Halomarina oriensis TaxID=671145 RepID=A0A6B0GSU2_9EURY|nr:hypothetical protein [Halomarina oriensis]MWG35165.1 hypothetical protein [Halomarina oriensis]